MKSFIIFWCHFVLRFMFVCFCCIPYCAFSLSKVVLFGPDYYKRQASAPAGCKSKGENKLPVWPQPNSQDNDDHDVDENVYQARAIEILTSDSDDNQMEAEPQAELEILEDLAEKPQIVRKEEKEELEEIPKVDVINQTLETPKPKPRKFKNNTSETLHKEEVTPEVVKRKVDQIDEQSPTPIPLVTSTSTPTDDSKTHNSIDKNISDMSISDFNSDSDLSYNMYDVTSSQVFKSHGQKEPNNNTTFTNNNNIPILRATRPKSLVFERQKSAPLQEFSYSDPPTVIRRKKDNTLISKIYMDPNVRKEALNKRNYTPELESAPATPTFRQLATPTSPAPQANFRLKPPSIQSVGIKVDDDVNGFETQEVQTNYIYSSEDSGDFLSRSSSVDKLDDEPIKEQNNKPNGLGKYSKSTPNLNEIKSKLYGSTEELDNTRSENPKEEIKVSVKDLMKLFEKKDAQKKGPVVHSLTARSVGRRVNTFRFS